MAVSDGPWRRRRIRGRRVSRRRGDAGPSSAACARLAASAVGRRQHHCGVDQHHSGHCGGRSGKLGFSAWACIMFIIGSLPAALLAILIRWRLKEPELLETSVAAGGPEKHAGSLCANSLRRSRTSASTRCSAWHSLSPALSACGASAFSRSTSSGRSSAEPMWLRGCRQRRDQGQTDTVGRLRFVVAKYRRLPRHLRLQPIHAAHRP